MCLPLASFSDRRARYQTNVLQNQRTGEKKLSRPQKVNISNPSRFSSFLFFLLFPHAEEKEGNSKFLFLGVFPRVGGLRLVHLASILSLALALSLVRLREKESEQSKDASALNGHSSSTSFASLLFSSTTQKLLLFPLAKRGEGKRLFSLAATAFWLVRMPLLNHPEKTNSRHFSLSCRFLFSKG